MRNSGADVSLYWLARMLEGGEDPLYIARRMIRFASEGIGMADSHALPLVVSVYQACHFIGMPECNDALAHAAVYLALAPKSRKVDDAYAAAAGMSGKSSAAARRAHKAHEGAGIREGISIHARKRV